MRETKLERDYQHYLIKKIEDEVIPGCIVLKNNANLRTGIPDLVVFFKRRYAMLEVKPYWNAALQPNQDWYIDLFDHWSFGAFIFPENEEEVLRELQSTLQPRRKALVSKS